MNEKPGFWMAKAKTHNDTYGWNDRPTQWSWIGTLPIAEICSIYATNGHETVIYRVLQDERFYGPFLGCRMYEGDGIERKVTDDWDMTPAAASAVDHLIMQRNDLARVLKSIINEVNSAGFLNRGEDCVTEAETILGYFDEANLPPLPPKEEVPA